MRTTVELPDTQVEALERICRREGISREEAIRRAVDKLIVKDEAETKQAFQESFGIWKNRQMDGREYVAALREEWEGRP